MIDWPILSVLICLPLIGVVFILSVRGAPEVVSANARAVAAWASLITFLISLYLWFSFDPTSIGFQFTEKHIWISSLGISYSLGIDGISLLLVVLTALLSFICIVASWESITTRVREYMIAFLLLETMMIGAFTALDTILFYIFFEGLLIPMFLIIGIWGGPRRVYASFKFFLYTLTGSVLFLIALLVMSLESGTTSIPELMLVDFSFKLQLWLWLALFASFAVKVPMWPLHTWLPDAHVEAPTAGSVILAGVLLKLGGYGFLRFSLPMLPEASNFYGPFIFTLSVVAIIYTSLVALMQKDVKKLIAYASVAHMGFVTIGLFTLTKQGIEGAMMIMLSHGLISGALFLCVGVVYDRVHSRLISSYGGLVHSMPVYALLFMIFTLASIGLPGTSGFVGELLVLVGAYQINTWVAALASTGIVLGAAYMLWLYRRMIFGVITNDNLKAVPDLKIREIFVFTPLVLGVLWMGVFPNTFLKVMHHSVDKLIQVNQ